jgi:hypothetical protein
MGRSETAIISLEEAIKAFRRMEKFPVASTVRRYTKGLAFRSTASRTCFRRERPWRRFSKVIPR